MRQYLLYLAIAAILASYSFAQASNLVTSYSVFGNWLPVIIAACILAILLATVHYGLGYVINSARVKGAAVSEMQQAGGSILLVVILVGIFYMIGTTQNLSFSGIIGPSGQSQIQQICANLKSSPLNITNSNNYELPSGLDGATTRLPSPTTAVCNYLINGNGVDPATGNIDYGLGATYVIMANMTNQSASEINSIYNFESLIFFLRNINPFITVCIPATCLNPFTGEFSDSIKLAYKPYTGYVLHRTIMPTIISQGMLSLYMYIIQDMFTLIIIIGWPYLLAAGILLRTLPFTRRAGGLITAAAIVAVLIYPTINLIEYSALNHLNPDSFIGASQIPGIALCGYGPVTASGSLTGATSAQSAVFCYTNAASLKTTYIYKNLPEPVGMPNTLKACSSPSEGYVGNPFVNKPTCYVQEDLSFYALPRADDIISFYSCYPTGASIFTTYTSVITDTLIGTATLPIGIILSLFSSSTSPLSIASIPAGAPGGCLAKIGPQYIMAALEGMANMYGIISVTAFMIPIINALLMISAITGISTLIGGEGTIIGLSRFI